MPFLERRGWRAAGLAAFVAGFAVLRLANLPALPIFVDEGIHLDWAHRMRATGRLLGITDGGRYLPIAIYALVAAPAEDPLQVARMCSAFFGLLAALGLIGLGRLLYSRAAGYVAASLWLVAPFCVFHDRMALVDSQLAALVVAILIFVTLWVRTARRAWALALGAALGCAGVTKLYGALLLLVPPMGLVFLDGRATPRLRGQMLSLYALALGLMLPVFLETRSTAAFVLENLWVFRADSQLAPGVLVGLERVVAWHLSYLTPVGCALAGLALVHSLVLPRSRADRFLLGFWAAWCLFFVVAGGRNWFPRYLLPALPPLLLATAQWSLRFGGLGAGALTLAFALSSWSFDKALLTDPASAPLPPIDRWQYVENWPAGYGLDEAVAFLRAEASVRGRIIVLRDSLSGPLREGLDLALRRAPAGIEPVTLDLSAEAPAPTVIEKLLSQPHAVYLVLEQPVERQLVLDLAATSVSVPIARFAKPALVRQIEVYRVRESVPALPWAAPGRRDGEPPGTAAPGELPAEELARSQLQRAWESASAGRWAEAEAYFRSCLALAPSQGGVHNDVAVALFLQGKAREAFESWRAVGYRDHGSVRARFNIAVARARTLSRNRETLVSSRSVAR